MVPSPSPPSSSSTLTTLNKLSKTLIRSLLRWTQLPHTKSAPFQLLLPSSLLQFNPTLIQQDQISIDSTHKLHATVCYFIRNLNLTSPKEYQKLLNETFSFLRYLNEQDAHLLTLYREHCYRNNENNYLSHEITIRIGEVVENKTLGYRGVCVNWTIDPKTSLQLITLLIDWYDFEQILHGSLPLQFYANEFKVVHDLKFKRIHHNLISDYFLRYDATLGIYIPKYSLAYTHPKDTQYLLQTYQKEILVRHRQGQNQNQEKQEMMKTNRPRKVYTSSPEPSYHQTLLDRHDKLVDISSEIQQFSTFILQSILKNLNDSNLFSPEGQANGNGGLLLSEIKDPKDLITTAILKPKDKLLLGSTAFASADKEIFLNGLPAPFASAAAKKEAVESPAPTPTPHVGLEILNEIIVLLYSIEELLLQLHQLLQTKPDFHLTSPPSSPFSSPSTSSPSSTLSEKKTEDLFKPPSRLSFKAFLKDLPLSLNSSPSSPSRGELYLKYLQTVMMEKNLQTEDNPLPQLSTSLDDQLQRVSLQILSKLFQIRQESEKILIARNQQIGGFSFFETLYQPKRQTQRQAQAIQRSQELQESQAIGNEGATGTATTTPSLPALEIDYLDPPVLYRVGQVIKHKQFGYRGICTGYDLRPTTDTSNWEGVKGLTLGQEQPFYRVVADSDDILKIFGTETREIFYVAQENIEPLSETDFKLIRNRLVGDYYKGYDPLSGEYIPKEKYLFMFPDPHSNRTHSDSSHDQDKEKGKDSYSEVRARQQKETEELLVGIHGAFRDPLVLSHEAAKLSSVNSLPSNDFLRRFGGFFHSNLTTVPPSANSTSLPPSFSPPVSSSSSSSPVSSIPLLSNSSLVYLLQTCATRAESETLTHIFWNLWMSSPSIDASRGLREGLNHLSRNNTNKARTYFQNALIHDPSLTEAYNKMATFESMEKHPVTCLKYSLQALQLIPSHYSAHAMTGISLLSMTKSTNSVRYQDALRSLTESLEFNPWSGWLATKLILLRTTSGRKIESVVKRRGTSSGGGGGGGGGSVRLVSSSEPKEATRQQQETTAKTTGDDGITEEHIGPVTRTVASNSRTMQKKKGSLIEFDLIPESTEAEEEEEAEGEAEDEKKEGSKSKSEEGDQKKSEGEDDSNDSDKKTE